MKQLLMRGSVYGRLIILEGVLIGIPLVILPFYPEEAVYAPSFLIPMLFSVLLGLFICIFIRDEDNVFEWQSPLQRGSLPVVFAWCFSFFVGAMPFTLSGQMNLVHALFEAVSGWTTTGLTVADVTVLPKIFLFHRSFMQFCGGLGFILMMVMIVQGKQSVSLYSAEGHSDRLMPNLKQTARIIFSLYIGFVVLGVLLYHVFGMNIFEAVCHSMSALSTAGFTTRAGSIGEYASFPIEVVTIVLMMIGASNFAVLLLLTKGKLHRLSGVSELRFMFGLTLVFTVLVGLSLTRNLNMSLLDGLHEALFGVVTTFTTTGYSTMNYSAWPPFAQGLTILLMLIGGSTGSTAGGIKMLRTYLLLRMTMENIRKRLSPERRVTTPTYRTVRGKVDIDSNLIADTTGFIACYMFVLIIGSLIMTLTADCTLTEGFFEFASALGTVGISCGITNPNTNTATLLLEMFAMILGRLEIFIVFVGIYSCIKAFNRKFIHR